MWLISHVQRDLLPFRSGFVRAMLGVQAGFGQPQTLYGTAMQQVLLDDLAHVPGMHKAVPDGIGIDHHHRAMLALIEAAQFVGADLPLQTCILDCVLESALELSATFFGAAWAVRALVALVGTDEEVMLELWHS
jgi:hypothetical protein